MGLMNPHQVAVLPDWTEEPTDPYLSLVVAAQWLLSVFYACSHARLASCTSPCSNPCLFLPSPCLPQISWLQALASQTMTLALPFGSVLAPDSYLQPLACSLTTPLFLPFDSALTTRPDTCSEY